jgi:predicted permease
VVPLAIGLGHRLVLAPFALWLLYMALGQAEGGVARIAILEMAMPPMLGASIVALEHDLEPELVAQMIGIGVPVSMLTAWAWWSLIGA